VALTGVVWSRYGLTRAVLYVGQEVCSPHLRRTTSRGGTPLLTLDCGAWLLKKMHSDLRSGSLAAIQRNRNMIVFFLDVHVKDNRNFLCTKKAINIGLSTQ
jgi:hypothetical protein